MVERITDPHKPVQFAPGCYRIPDGHIVPIPPRPQPPAEARPAPLPMRQKLPGLIVAAVVLALTAAGIAGWLG